MHLSKKKTICIFFSYSIFILSIISDGDDVARYVRKKNKLYFPF